MLDLFSDALRKKMLSHSNGSILLNSVKLLISFWIVLSIVSTAAAAVGVVTPATASIRTTAAATAAASVENENSVASKNVPALAIPKKAQNQRPSTSIADGRALNSSFSVDVSSAARSTGGRASEHESILSAADDSAISAGEIEAHTPRPASAMTTSFDRSAAPGRESLSESKLAENRRSADEHGDTHRSRNKSEDIHNELPQADASAADLSPSGSPEFPPRNDAVYFIVAISGGAKVWSRTLARTLVDLGPPFDSARGPPLRPLYIDLPSNGR